MVVAVITMRVVQVTIDEVVDVIAMRDHLVAAARAVDVIRVMPGATMLRRTPVGVLFADLERVLVAVTLVRVVKRTVMQVVYVVAMDDCDVTATGTVGVRMIDNRVTGLHCLFLRQCWSSAWESRFRTRFRT